MSTGYLWPNSPKIRTNGKTWYQRWRGVIDPDYCGKVGVVLFINNAKETFHIEKGDKIAQLFVEKIDDTP